MSIDERLRLNIHNRLSDLIGTEEADALISHIMPVPGHDVASKNDMQILRADLHAEIAQLRTDLGGEIADLRSEMHSSFVAQTRWMIGFMVTWSGVLLAAIRLFG